MELGHAVWPDINPRCRLLIPLGSTEQHGPHLPLDTDTRIAIAIATRATAQVDAVVAPAVAYGASGEHDGFAGTLSIGHDALTFLLVELVRSASMTFANITLVNGHGGNHAGLSAAVKQLQDEGHQVTSWSPRIPGGDAHAGRTETSLMLALAPELVQLDKAEPGNTSPLSELIDDLRSGGVVAASPNGILGDPSGASAEEGHDLISALVADLVKTLQ